MPFWFNGHHHRTIEVALLGASRIPAKRVPAPHDALRHCTCRPGPVHDIRRTPEAVPRGFVAVIEDSMLPVLHRGHHVFRAVEALRGRVADLVDHTAFRAVLLKLADHFVLRCGEVDALQLLHDVTTTAG